MRQSLLSVARRLLLGIGHLSSPLLFDLNVEGLHHVPSRPEPLLLIANHFSWFDAPILSLQLPIPPVFLVATEAHERRWVALLLHLFEAIPIWRGQVDRTALRRAVDVLQQEKIVGIFPEGGINPELAEQVARGEVIPDLRGNTGRQSAQLVRARAGVALLAVMSNVRILPVGLLGTERILANLPRGRRTPITMRIGAPFGPLQIDPALSGQARRRQLDALADHMMGHIAVLLPAENRGYYRASEHESASSLVSSG
jgi:1-acyl-sn-glycerol-3-phosphate acyltransferase